MVSTSDLERQIQHVSSSTRKMRGQRTTWDSVITSAPLCSATVLVKYIFKQAHIYKMHLVLEFTCHFSRVYTYSIFQVESQNESLTYET